MKKPATAIAQKPATTAIDALRREIDELRQSELKLEEGREHVAKCVDKLNQILRVPSEVERRRLRRECEAEMEPFEVEVANEEARHHDLYLNVLRAIEAADDEAVAAIKIRFVEKRAANAVAAARHAETDQDENAVGWELEAAEQRAAESKRRRIAAETPLTPEQRREADYSARLQAMAAAQPQQLDDASFAPSIDELAGRVPQSVSIFERIANAEVAAQARGGVHV